MAVELHLPDLPEVPISLGAARPRRAPMPWHLRLRDAVTAYLPLLLMALLALASWWLVKYTPGLPQETAVAPDPGVPDYTMHSFSVQRYAADGHLRVQLEGQALRHFPFQDRTEIDEVRLRAVGPKGGVIRATASQAVSNGEVSVIQLRGGAEVVGTDAEGQVVEIRSEFLQALLETQVVQTDRPVQVLHGTNRLSAAGLSYDVRRRQLAFQGPVRAVLQVPRR